MNSLHRAFFTQKSVSIRLKWIQWIKKPLAFGEKPIFSNQISESANKKITQSPFDWQMR